MIVNTRKNGGKTTYHLAKKLDFAYNSESGKILQRIGFPPMLIFLLLDNWEARGFAFGAVKGRANKQFSFSIVFREEGDKIK
jgi:hypothetical protein